MCSYNTQNKYFAKIEKYTPRAHEIKPIQTQYKGIIDPLIISVTGITQNTFIKSLETPELSPFIHLKIQKSKYKIIKKRSTALSWSMICPGSLNTRTLASNMSLAPSRMPIIRTNLLTKCPRDNLRSSNWKNHGIFTVSSFLLE